MKWRIVKVSNITLINDLGIANLGEKLRKESSKIGNTTERIVGVEKEQEMENENNLTLRWMSVANSKSMANILLQGLNNPLSIPAQLNSKKPLWEKYREFFGCLSHERQVLTHIELHTIELKGDVSMAVVDSLSYLRRSQNLPKIPQWVIEYLKKQVKIKRYR